jgi:tetraacyldisaccharide 4'-kinase
MALKTPEWWYQKHPKAPWWRPLLWPVSKLWAVVTARKIAKAIPYHSRLKVISVGNLTAGGSGKTPIAHEILRLLNAQGYKAVGLSRGYGGSLTGPINVDFNTHIAAEVGDEPLLIAEDQPMWIARDRAEGLRSLEATDAQIVVVDDAHQNVAIHKDVHIVVVDGDTSGGQWPFGDGGIVPYGPLREDFKAGLMRADLIVLWLPEGLTPDPELVAIFEAKPVLIARLVPETIDTAPDYVAFAGIAKPWRFETTLKAAGVRLKGFKAFADHQPLTPDDIAHLQTQAQAAGAQLITTQKDWTRLAPEDRARIKVLRIRAKFEDETRLIQSL